MHTFVRFCWVILLLRYVPSWIFLAYRLLLAFFLICRFHAFLHFFACILFLHSFLQLACMLCCIPTHLFACLSLCCTVATLLPDILAICLLVFLICLDKDSTIQKHSPRTISDSKRRFPIDLLGLGFRV